MTETKQIPLNGEPFSANGKTYYIEDSLSIDRWLKMNDLTIQLGFGTDYSEMQKNWREVLDLANEMRFADIVIMAHNMVNGISKVYSRQPMILKFCALFMNTEEEDRGMITEDQIARKIEDWKTEGLGIDGFFVFSLSKVKDLAEGYANATQSVLTNMAEVFPSNQAANEEPNSNTSTLN